MIVSHHHQYGWGAHSVPMPRAAVKNHPGLLSNSGAIACVSQAGSIRLKWQASKVYRIIIGDVSWKQPFVISILFSVLLVAIYSLNRVAPVDPLDAPIKPVDIVVAMQNQESPDTQPFLDQLPLEAKEPKYTELTPITTPSNKNKPEKVVVQIPSQPKKRKIRFQSKRSETNLQLPIAKLKPKTYQLTIRQNQPAKAVKRKITTELQPDPLASAATVARQREYTLNDPDMALPQSQASPKSTFQSRKHDLDIPNKVANDAVYQSKNYRIPLENNLKSTFQSRQHDPDVPKRVTNDPVYQSKNYRMPIKNERMASQPPAPSHAFKGDFSKTTTDTPLVASRLPQKQYHPQKKSTGSELTGASRADRPLSFNSQRSKGLSNAPPISPSQGSGSARLLSGTVKPGGPAPKATDNPLSFRSKKEVENIQALPGRAGKSVAKANRSADKEVNATANAPSLVYTAEVDQAEPSKFISLKEFNVCIDPEEEFRLKTKLAAYLPQPSQVDARGIVFLFQHTKSGYTIDIAVYNAIGRHFKDRCEVLALAIDSVVKRD